MSLILTVFFGLLLSSYPGVFDLLEKWVWIKIIAFIALLFMHVLFVKHYKNFQNDKNRKSARYFRRCNEIPFIFPNPNKSKKMRKKKTVKSTASLRFFYGA